MIEFERVLGAFSLLADIDGQTARDNSTVVHMGIEEVRSMINPENETSENADRLCHAAAACAYYKYIILLSSRDAAEMKVGDISVKPSDITVAKALRDDAIDALSDLCGARNFAFLQV